MHSRHERRFGRQRMAFCESVFIYAETAGHFALLACHEYATWLLVLNIGTRDHSRNRPKGGRNSPQHHTSTRFAGHFSQFILSKSLEASSKNITWCILYETSRNSLRQIYLKR